MPIEIRSDPPFLTQALLQGVSGFTSRQAEAELMRAQLEAAQKQKLFDAIGGAVGQIGSGYFEGLQKRRLYDMQLQRDDLQHQARMEEIKARWSQKTPEAETYMDYDDPGFTHNMQLIENERISLDKGYAEGEISREQHELAMERINRKADMIVPPTKRRKPEPTPQQVFEMNRVVDPETGRPVGVMKPTQYGLVFDPFKAEKEEDDESTVTFKAVEAEMGRLQGMSDQQAKTTGTQPRMVTFQEAYQSLTNRKAEFRGATGQMTPEETQQVGEATSIDYVIQQHGPEPSAWPPAVRLAMVPRARHQLELIRESWGDPKLFTEEQKNRLRFMLKVLDPNAGN